MAQIGHVLCGRYRLEKLLGEGGMGQVWVARHLQLDTLVAVKLMLEAAVDNDMLRARFEREARASAQLRCANVVQVFDYGVDRDVPFLVMELLDGEDLSAAMERREYWSLEEASRVVSQAAKGLASVHGAGVVHRDIKPSNLFIAQIDGDTIVKVLDFGIAKTFDPDAPQMTKTNMQIGSPNYMSPEMVIAAPVDGRSDGWALGVVAFQLLTGTQPFVGQTAMAVSQKILFGERDKPSDLVQGLPLELDAFFDRALALKPDDRFRSPTHMAEALAAIAAKDGRARGTPAIADEATIVEPTEAGRREGRSLARNEVDEATIPALPPVAHGGAFRSPARTEGMAGAPSFGPSPRPNALASSPALVSAPASFGPVAFRQAPFASAMPPASTPMQPARERRAMPGTIAVLAVAAAAGVLLALVVFVLTGPPPPPDGAPQSAAAIAAPSEPQTTPPPADVGSVPVPSTSSSR